MDTKQKSKEILRVFDELEEILPDILMVLARERRPETAALIARLESLKAKVIQLREATDCMPAAELGRKESA